MKRLVSPIITAVAASTLSFNALSAEIKNVILMIGDGMGPQQVGLLETYANHAPNSIYKGQNHRALQVSARRCDWLIFNEPRRCNRCRLCMFGNNARNRYPNRIRSDWY